ncbi:hypothetical protein [Rosistilla oblonga]|uniref:hypothetical protein n=1 Tax=Rosistilla oblonga TaxID=2527990 RepID=UPI003A983B74
MAKSTGARKRKQSVQAPPKTDVYELAARCMVDADEGFEATVLMDCLLHHGYRTVSVDRAVECVIAVRDGKHSGEIVDILKRKERGRRHHYQIPHPKLIRRFV